MSDPFGGHKLALPFRSVADLLAAYRERDPGKQAIVDLDQNSRIDFGELDPLVTDIAADLKRRGVKKGDHVVLLANEVLEKLLLWLGIWRIGAVVCPITVELHAEHLTFIAHLVAPKLILIHEELDVAPFTGEHVPIVRFGNWRKDQANLRDEYFAKVPRGADPASLPERNTPTDLAGMVCTSGTTDRPKIVVYDHASYWLMGLDTIDMLGLTSEDRTLEYRSFGWNSAQILSLLPFLQLGPTMHIARRFSNSRFFDWVRDNGITFAAGVPTVLNMLLNRPPDQIPDVPALRRMSCSSAPLSPEQWERFEKMYGIALLQLYGMSEAGWICGNTHYKHRMGTVGPPAIHQEFAIVDEQGRPCPPNIEGEVTVGGPQASIGLLQDDGTIAPVRGRRFKSGDLATMDEDGFVRITGRTKDLIIRGGLNVSPVEVDAVILAHPALADGACVGVPDPIYGEEIVAFGVLRPGAKQDEAAFLRDFAQKLPLPKQPKRMFFVAELPKSDRGKVLRDRLREEWVRLTAT
jgi:acyl-CoA synthetase (AMP-forming)/AMP-acid ligase II